jgi:ribose transport system ATP-binding protein
VTSKIEHVYRSGPDRPGLEARGVKKAFGGVAALVDGTLSVRAGEIHAVLGQNGAGKSTLMNILAGDVVPDAGELTLGGARYAPGSPLEARKAGVAMVHQELSICPHLSVAENVMLFSLPARGGVVDVAAMRTRTAEVLDPLAGKGAIDPDAPARELSPASLQLVEIARAIADPSCRVLLLDEPTSSLAAGDVERLFDVLRGLRARGDLAIVYLSHFLEEVKEIADRFTVLRDGATVGQGDVESTPIGTMVELMAGRPVEQLFPRSAHTPGDVVLSVASLAGDPMPKKASLELRKGEVLGLAGLVGAGRTELLRCIFGLDAVRSGTVKVGLAVGPASPARRLDQGVGMLSEERKGEGLCLGLSIADNLTLSKLDGLGPGPLVLAANEDATARRWIQKLGVKCQGPEQKISELSGGNQQKVAIARLLHHDVDVLLLDEPTRGIDVEAKSQIYALVDELAQRGKAVLVVSSYLPELVGICDRVQVMSRGALGPSHDASATTEATLLREATGA